VSSAAIHVEGLWKEYRLGARGRRNATLYDAISSRLRRPFRRVEDRSEDRFWALADVGFDVSPGEVLGVIGHNGAGKSTLLKVLTRITDPTRGRGEIRGRVSSLLEVGTGFHPELSGRDNVFLNGAILGMSRREIAGRFDEIVAFAEVEKFLDTPVKRYSSGMYVRLAFAVAAHLEPDVLIVDEVLAVGDAAFQERCLGRMREVGSEGRAVVFVSHNMAAVSSLCTHCMVLNKGSVTYLGEVDSAIRHYLHSGAVSGRSAIDLSVHPFRRAGCEPLLRSVTLRRADGSEAAQFEPGGTMLVDLELAPSASLDLPELAIGVDDIRGARVFAVATYLSSSRVSGRGARRAVRAQVDAIPLAPGSYFLSLSCGDANDHLRDAIDHAVEFEVVSSDFYGNGSRPNVPLGEILMRSTWVDLD
jgi:lipopolysaccharide transport system ATP-binding protein